MNDIAFRKVVYELPNMDEVTIKKNIIYDKSKPDELNFDLYLPNHPNKRLPAVIFIFGFSDSLFGKGLKQMEQYKCWAKLFALKGIAAITYSYTNPEEDIQKLISYLSVKAYSLGIDITNVGIWACSGNVPLGLSILVKNKFKCAAFLYGYMIDSAKVNYTKNASLQFGFVNPDSTQLLSKIETPIFLVRAGKDQMPNINETIDLFVLKSLENNLVINLINYSSGEHAFDLYNDNAVSREIIKKVIEFYLFHLQR